MDNKDQKKWYFKPWALIVSFLSVGPFMLPLVWTNPSFSKMTKIIISAVIIILSYLLASVFIKSLQSLGSYYQLLQT
jgi:purine-cytosine permease-like protein